MLTRIRFWHIFVAQVFAGAAFVSILALVIHFPDVARRPNPPPVAGLVLFVLMTIALVGMHWLYIRIHAHTAVATVVTVLVWLVAIYGFVFVWINTYGT